jgi:hypothetical protein
MITNFKIFESNEPKFKIGDTVVVKNHNIRGEIIKISKSYYDDITGFSPTGYILDTLPNLSIREDSLELDYKVDSKKYNI